ncbi:MAG: plasmid pRiA4b ORF-3 family protein [Bacteroidetes bacterium]|nr:plasmid pRiA4b ORF-3 family protein [Bacteroidota bacterium]
MITIHATKKLLTKLKIAPETEAAAKDGRLGAWYADLRVVNRRLVVFALNERTLLCVIVPYASLKSDPAAAVAAALRPVLEAVGVPNDVIGTELAAFNAVSFTTTASRVMLGRLRHAIDDAEYQLFRGEALDTVAVRMSSFMYSAGKGQPSMAYLFPYDLVGSTLDIETHSPMPFERSMSIPVPSPPIQQREPVAKRSAHEVDTLILRISLDGIRPEIWRTVMVPANITLRRLHDVIQAAMGWDDSHLHLFTINGTPYGDRQVFDDMPQMKDEKFVNIGSLGLAPGSTFSYEYDMGDGWRHTISVVGTDSVSPDATYRVIDGANAVPPEDIGGTYGYARFVLAMMDPKHEDHDEVLQWYGRPFDHTMFDLRAAQRFLFVLVHTGAGYPWRS